MHKRLYGLAAAIVLTVLPVHLHGQSSADARKAYDAWLQEAKRLYLKCDAVGLAALVTEDYTAIDPSGQVLKGRAAEMKEDRDFCAANSIVDWVVNTTEFHSHGPLAWSAGTATSTAKTKATGKVEKNEGHFLAIYAQQADKKWLLQYFMMTPLKVEKK